MLMRFGNPIADNSSRLDCCFSILRGPAETTHVNFVWFNETIRCVWRLLSSKHTRRSHAIIVINRKQIPNYILSIPRHNKIIQRYISFYFVSFRFFSFLLCSFGIRRQHSSEFIPFVFCREIGGILEPPVTPIGRDELALKRHRFFSELLTAAQAAVEHRVRFDPFGPKVDGNFSLYLFLSLSLLPPLLMFFRNSICMRTKAQVSLHDIR